MSRSQARTASRPTQPSRQRSVPAATKSAGAKPAAKTPAKVAAKAPPGKSPAAKVPPAKAPPSKGPLVKETAGRRIPQVSRVVETRVVEVERVAPATAPAVDAMWPAYAAARDRGDERRAQELRNRLIERYYDVVRYTAERMHTRLPSEVDVNDLMSAGLFGLMDAIDAFDPGRGVKFETYCAPRIRGAIFDELRSMDWVPRLVRSRTAKVDKVRKEIELSIGRKPTDAEVAERMNVPASEFEKLQKDSRPVGVVSLDRKCFETDSSRDVREVDVIEDGRQAEPSEVVQRSDLQTLITKGLTRAERLIVILYYYEEMTMKEIGLTLDLSESRVSQMHSSILARLKAQMQHRMKDF